MQNLLLEVLKISSEQIHLKNVLGKFAVKILPKKFNCNNRLQLYFGMIFGINVFKDFKYKFLNRTV